MAPLYHSAMKNVAEVRAKIKIPTIFNLVGPMINPASANIQLIGVYSYNWLMPIAKCLKELKIKKAWIVHGQDGLDEIARVKMDSNYRAIAVSGNYRKFREEGKRKIVHSIDPRNGQPSETNVLSATVLSDEAAICDAYATAFMIMRIEDIIPLIESNNLNIDALIIFHDANNNLQTYVSTNLEDKLLYPVSQP